MTTFEPSSTAIAWANKHRDVFEALLRANYSRAEALTIMNAEVWSAIFDA